MGYNHKAFSFVELLVTISIAILFFTLTIPKFSFVNRFALRNELDKLFVIFEFLKQRSIATNKKHYLYFDVKNNCYSYKLDDENKDRIVTHKLPKAVKFGYLKSALWPPSNPINKINRSIFFKRIEKKAKYKAKFLPDGKILPGSVLLIEVNHQYMGALTCSVGQISYIRKYNYKNGKWSCLN